MTYFLLFVAMLIALASQFFESVKKDGAGKQRTTTGGIPVLTLAGRFIFVLIFLSFLGSILSTWFDKRDGSRKEKALSESLGTVQKENHQLLDSMRDLSKSSSTQFAENLSRLETIRKQEEATGTVTASSIGKLRSLETKLVPSKYIDFDILFDPPRMKSEELRRVLNQTTAGGITFGGTKLDDQLALERMICGEKNQSVPLEIQIRLSSAPDIDYVIGYDADKPKCSVVTAMRFDNSQLETGKLPSGGVEIHRENDPLLNTEASEKLSKRVSANAEENRSKTSVVLVGEIRPEEYRIPLVGGSFGQHPYAKAVFRSDSIGNLKARLPKSMTIVVEIWTTLPEFAVNPGTPSSVKMWQLVLIEGGLANLGEVEYDYESIEAEPANK